MRVLGLVLALACTSGVIASGEHASSGGTVEYEWGGLFETTEDIYTWISQKVDPAADAPAGSVPDYADATMKLAVLPATGGTDAVLAGLVAEGLHSLNMNCTEADGGDVIQTAEDACVELHFDPQMYQTMWKINATGQSYIAIFAQHVPTEFEKDTHYLRDDHGDDVEPLHEVPETPETSRSKPWGKVIGTCILVALCTFSGVVLAVPAFGNLRSKFSDEFDAVSSAFAGGAILSTAFYLVLFESTHFVAAFIPEGGDEVEATWRWGTAVLGGFSLPLFTEAVRKAIVPGAGAAVSPTDVEKGGVDATQSKYRVMAGVLIGDFMHNVVDGILIATAFYLCNDTKGWAVVGATIGHEIAQEIGDYILLTGDLVNLSIPKALLFNFISGLSVIVGAIAMLESNPNNKEQGIIMAFGGGTYVAIGAAECMPRVFANADSAKTMWLSVLSFVVGVVAIGLVLLDHEHCIPSDGDGHGHGSH